jgi:hypothetical protein
VAAVATVVDITLRTLEGEWPNPENPIRTEFESRVDTFRTHGDLVFVRDYRNYCLHKSLPPVQALEEWSEDEGFSASVRLGTATLLEWDRWKKPARTLVEAAGPSIELLPLIDRYVGEALALQKSTLDSIENIKTTGLTPWHDVAEEHDRLVSEHITRHTRRNVYWAR